jgi:SnoaL-like domain
LTARSPAAAVVLNDAMLSQAEISDRLEIQQLLVTYSEAIDRRRFDELDEVFVPDAYIDYRATGGIDGRYPEIKTWLADVLPKFFSGYAHMLGLPAIHLDGDTATARTFCFNPMVFTGEQATTMLIGLWYEDEFVRAEAGWRMSRRVEVKCFDKQ